jgi:hypothetical protein
MRRLVIALAAVFTFGCGSTPTAAPAPVAPAAVRPYVVDTVATGLRNPWSLAFLPDGAMLVTEKYGTLRLFTPKADRGEPVEGDKHESAVAEVLVERAVGQQADDSDGGRLLAGEAGDEHAAVGDGRGLRGGEEGNGRNAPVAIPRIGVAAAGEPHRIRLRAGPEFALDGEKGLAVGLEFEVANVAKQFRL